LHASPGGKKKGENFFERRAMGLGKTPLRKDWTHQKWPDKPVKNNIRVKFPQSIEGRERGQGEQGKEI